MCLLFGFKLSAIVVFWIWTWFGIHFSTTGMNRTCFIFCLMHRSIQKVASSSFLFFYFKQGFVIKSNELSINSISKTVAILMLNCISKGASHIITHYFFALAFIQRIFWPNVVAPLAIKSWIAIFHWQNIISIYGSIWGNSYFQISFISIRSSRNAIVGVARFFSVLG
jgi:hypothetical protein